MEAVKNIMIIKRKEGKKLGDILIDSELITKEQLDEALELQVDSGKLLGAILVENGICDQKKIMMAIKQQLDLEIVTLRDQSFDSNVIGLFKDTEFLKKNVCFPYEVNDEMLKLAMADPLDTKTIDDVSAITGRRVIPVIAEAVDILTVIEKYYGTEQVETLIDEFDETKIETIETADTEEEAQSPVTKLVNILFEQAIHMRASDIHIEPMENSVRVRFRVDGDLVKQTKSYPLEMLSPIITRIKILGGMNIAERRRPQDGRLTTYVDDKEYDIRVSVIPTTSGEKIVMRIADKNGFVMKKADLGLSPDDEKRFNSLLQNQSGIILVTGPTGSGKSTTLYTALTELNSESVNIQTIEDPVEVDVPGISQVQINEKAGVTFPTMLRSFLRQDPDIIMVGEIRDKETVNLAIDAALTGHLVVSTLHTNSAISTISRLEKMGVEPYLISDAVTGILAQRLVKRLCDCKKERTLTENDKKRLDIDNTKPFPKIYDPCGCEKCNQTGYYGRIAVYEILVLSDEIKIAIADEKPISEITKLAEKQNFITIKENTKRLVKEGITSIQEFDRTVHEAKAEIDKID